MTQEAPSTPVLDALPRIDLEQARQFIECLTGSADAAVSFQTFADVAKSGSDDAERYRERDTKRKKAKQLIKVMHGKLAEHAAELTRLNQRGAGVFLSVNETTLKGRKADDVVKVRALFADFDDPATYPFERIEALTVKPHLVVESSPGKWHAYWRTADCNVAEFQSMQRLLIRALDSDSSINDPSRVMRLPGFLHHKGEPFLTRTHSTSNDAPYAMATLREGLLGGEQEAANTAAAAKPQSPKKERKPTAKTHWPCDMRKTRSALEVFPTSVWDNRDEWLHRGMELHEEGARTDTLPEHYDLWCEFSAKSLKFDEADSRSKWASLSEQKDKNTRGIASLFFEAKHYGWKQPSPFSLGPDGVYYNGTDKDGQPLPPLWLCGKLEVTATATDDEGMAARLLEFENEHGNLKQWIMPMQLLAGDGTEVRAALLGRGLRISSSRGAREQLSAYLNSSADGLEQVACTGVPGWHGSVYVTPTETIGRADAPRVIYRGTAPAQFAKRGTIEQWRDRVAALAIGNSRLTFAVAVAFAAPLLQPLGLDGVGFHFAGESSLGKTSIARVACSVWGGERYLQKWRATANGLEGVAVAHNGTLLVLDDIGQCNGKELGLVSYMLADGKGKLRASRTGAARSSATWKLIYLSTGEISLAESMRKAGERAEAGQEIRLIEIAADTGSGCGIYETIHGRPDGAALSDELCANALKYHGGGGAAFLRNVADDYDACMGALRMAHAMYTEKLVPGGAGGQAKRAARSFGLVAAAGELATRIGLTGWPEGAALEATAVCYRAWLAERGGAGNAERRATLQQIRGFIEAHGSSRFQWLAAERPESARIVTNQAGFKEQLDDGGARFYVFPQVFADEMCKGRNKKTAAALLVREGWLLPGAEGKASQTYRLPGMGPKRCYVLAPKALTADIG